MRNFHGQLICCICFGGSIIYGHLLRYHKYYSPQGSLRKKFDISETFESLFLKIKKTNDYNF